MIVHQSAMTDEEIARRIADGDAEAFKNLIENYGERIRLIVRINLDNRPDEWVDICQEIHIALFEAIRRRKKIDNLPGYVWRICNNKIADWQRGEIKKRGIVMSKDNDLMQLPAAESERPDAAMLEEEQQSLIDRAIRKLDNRTQRIIRSRYWEGKKYEQIAIEHDDNPANIRKICQRAREKLSRLL